MVIEKRCQTLKFHILSFKVTLFPGRVGQSWPSTAHPPAIVLGFTPSPGIAKSPPSLVTQRKIASQSPETRPDESKFGGKKATSSSFCLNFTGTRCPCAPCPSLPRAFTSSLAAAKERFSSGNSSQGVASLSCHVWDRTWRPWWRRTRLSLSRWRTMSSRSSPLIWMTTRWSRGCRRKRKIQVPDKIKSIGCV